MTECCGVNWRDVVLRCLHCGKHLNTESIIVKVQRMFPNGSKYRRGCQN